jgi:hypothetical protein
MPSIWILLIPSFFDLIVISTKNVALVLMAASIVQMFRSSLVMFTAIQSVLFLKRILYRHHWSSLAAILGGIVLVGVSHIITGDTKISSLGIIVLLVGQFFGATGYVIEEKILEDYKSLDPLLLAGIQGVLSFSLCLIILPLMQLIPCSDPVLCPGGLLENSLGAFKEVRAQPLHLVWIFMIITNFIFMYSCGLNVTKYGSAAQRSTIENVRDIFVWSFFIFVPVFGVVIESFNWI